MKNIVSTIALTSIATAFGIAALAPLDADAASKKRKACFINGIRVSPDNCEERERWRREQQRALPSQRRDRRFNFGSDPQFGRDRGGGDGGGGGNRSDIRLKRDIHAVGQLANGLKLYRFKYLWSEIEWVGVMAQEVLDVLPEAVSIGSDGFYRVDYDLLGTPMLSLEEWQVLQDEQQRHPAAA